MASPRVVHRLLLQGLPEKDRLKMSMFLSLGAHRLRARWQIVNDGDCDAVLFDGDHVATIAGMLEEPRVRIHVLAERAASDSPLQLTRPLEYDAVMEVLLAAEGRLSGSAPTSPAPAPLATAATRSATEAPKAAPRLAAAVGAAPQTAPAQVPHTDWPGSTFQLKRWPPTELLRGDRENVRLATFMSTRKVSLEELARLSNVNPEKCKAFITTMYSAGLMSTGQSPAVHASAPTHPPSSSNVIALRPMPPIPKPAGRSDTLGIIGRLRRRLGLSHA